MDRARSGGGWLAIGLVGMLMGAGMMNATTAAEPRARAVGFQEKQVYHSSEKVGHCAWVQLWREPEGGLRISFSESRTPKEGRKPTPIDIDRWEVGGMPATYNFSGLISETVYMRSTDEGKSWTKSGSGGGAISPVSLPDGRMLGLSWASGYPGKAGGGGLMESTDGGKTWKRVHEIMDDDHYIVYPFVMRLLNDKKTLMVYCPYAPTYGPGKEFPVRNATKPGVPNAFQGALYWSRDFGKTFVGPITIYPGQSVSETDFVELPSGDLLFMHHKMYTGKCHRQLVRRTKLGYVPEAFERVGDSMPEMFLRTKDGYLVGASRNGPYLWSDDDGMTWRPVEDAPPCNYQPRAMMIEDDTILFCWHKGADLAYQEADMWIGQHTFKLEMLNPKMRTKLRLGRVKDEAKRKYIPAFTATLTTEDGKPVAGKPIEFSIAGRYEAGYANFGGGTPWVGGKTTTATTNENGVARVDYPEQQKITDIHKSFQLCARFDPERKDGEHLPATTIVWEYYAVTPVGGE